MVQGSSRSGSYIYVVSLTLGILAAACQNNVRTVDDLLSYVGDASKGVVQETVYNDVTMKVTYHPQDIIALRNMQGMPDGDIDSVRRSLREYDYFLLQLSDNGQEMLNRYVNTPRFNEAVQYISFAINEDIRLIHARDTIPAFDVIHTRTYGASASTAWLIAFKSALTRRTGTCVVQFDDSFFGLGKQNFAFDIAAIKRIPTLDHKPL